MKGADFTVKCALVAAALAGGCAHAPAPGNIWDTRAERFVSADDVYARAARATHVILGETHDNPEQHRLQRQALERLTGPRALAMEQFDSEYQAAIDAAQAKGADADTLAEAGHFDRKGWNWPLYRPLVEFALEHRWPIVAANLSRAAARIIVRDPAASGLPPAPALSEELARDIADSHCGERPPEKLLAGMVEAQRARDAHMASRLNGRAVLITGSGHARRDRGVPLYLPGADILSIGFVEVDADRKSPRDYLAGLFSPASFDYVWFTERAQREDPCAN